MPCEVLTKPEPTLRGEQKNVADVQGVGSQQAPRTSTSASSAPASWRWTERSGRPWTFASASNSLRKIFRPRVLDARRERAPVDDPFDVGQGPLHGPLALDDDVDLEPAEMGPLGLLDPIRTGSFSRPIALTKRSVLDPQIEERPEDHVPAQPRGRVEIHVFHILGLEPGGTAFGVRTRSGLSS